MITKIQKKCVHYSNFKDNSTFPNENKSKAPPENGAMNECKKNFEISSKVWHRIVQNETQWTRIRRITQFNHSLTTCETQ